MSASASAWGLAARGRPAFFRWSLSAGIVLACHAAVSGIMLALQIHPMPEVQPPALMLELAPMPEPARAAAAPVLVPPPPPEPEQKLQLPIPEAKAEAMLPAPPPKPKPQPKTKLPSPKPEPSPVVQAPAQEAVPALAAAPAAVAAPRPDTDVGAARPAAPAFPPDAMALYQARLAQHLERNKRYPRDAQLRRQQGIVHLQFAMDAAGRVLSAKVARASGYVLLDEEVPAMLRRAEPLPVPPPGLFAGSLEFTIPVQFNLK